MLIKESCNEVILYVLVDTGSTHNFNTEHIMKRLNQLVQEVIRIWVEVANGQKLKCKSICRNFEWEEHYRKYGKKNARF